MPGSLSFSNTFRNDLIRKKCGDDEQVKQMLESLVLSKRLDTAQVNWFLAHCPVGQSLLQQFHTWRADNHNGCFESFVFSQV